MSWTVWPEKDAMTPYMNYCHKTTLILPKMQDQKLLTFFWHSVSGWGWECVAHTFATKGSQYRINGCLQQMAGMISLDANTTIIHTRLMLIFRIGQWSYCSLCRISRLPICWLCITVTKLHFNCLTCNIKNHWHSIYTYLSILPIQHLLPSLIILITLQTEWLPFWLIDTQPFGKGEWSNILALFALIQLTLIFPAI